MVIHWLVFQLKTTLFVLELYGPGPQGVWISAAAGGMLMSTSTSSWDLPTHIWGFGGRVDCPGQSQQDGGTIGVSLPRQEAGERGWFLRDGRSEPLRGDGQRGFPKARCVTGPPSAE